MNTVGKKMFWTNHSNLQLSNSKKNRKNCLMTKPSPSPRRTISNLPWNQPTALSKNPSMSSLSVLCGPEGGRPRHMIQLRFLSSQVGRKKRPCSCCQGRGVHHEYGNPLQDGGGREQLWRRLLCGWSGWQIYPGGLVQVLCRQQRRAWY